MRKKFKRLANKIFAALLTFGVLFQVFAPTIVSAMDVQDVSKVIIGGSTGIDGNTFNYQNGSVTVTKKSGSNDPVAINTAEFTVAAGDIIGINFLPNENFTARLVDESDPNDIHNCNFEGSYYEFQINSTPEGEISRLKPVFSDKENIDPPIGDLKFDFTINGQSFTNVSIGDDLIVPNNFNMDTLEELYITKIIDGDRRTYDYAEGEYSYDLLNDEGNPILETHFIKRSNSFATLRVEAHADRILAADLNRNNKTVQDYFGLYITGVKLVKESFNGVEITTGVMPDNYDFTGWNGVDLGETTINEPGTVTAYYGDDTISFNSQTEKSIKKIELVEGKGVPASAVEINNEDGTIKILSNYYNQILVKVELEDGTVGYVNIDRIGIFIDALNKGESTFLHGAFARVSNNMNVETDKQRIAAVFYHEKATSYEDYDLIVNITYTDGKTETKLSKGVGDILSENETLIGSDYILWSGDSLDAVEEVSVMAVKKGATTNEKTFGGATFGSGSGVVWKRK